LLKDVIGRFFPKDENLFALTFHPGLPQMFRNLEKGSRELTKSRPIPTFEDISNVIGIY
jgi:hypothetical protein